VSVATVRLVEEAKNFIKLEIEVVEVTPFTEVVMIPLFAEILFEFMREVVEVLPFTTEVISFTAEVKSF
jgi:hypothetical protein